MSKKLIQDFISDLVEVQAKHGLKLGIDDINPFELVVLGMDQDKIKAWLGTEFVTYDDARIVIVED